MGVPSLGARNESIKGLVDDDNRTFAFPKFRAGPTVNLLVGARVNESVRHIADEAVEAVSVCNNLQQADALSFDDRSVRVEMTGINDMATDNEAGLSAQIRLDVEHHTKRGVLKVATRLVIRWKVAKHLQFVEAIHFGLYGILPESIAVLLIELDRMRHRLGHCHTILDGAHISVVAAWVFLLVRRLLLLLGRRRTFAVAGRCTTRRRTTMTAIATGLGGIVIIPIAGGAVLKGLQSPEAPSSTLCSSEYSTRPSIVAAMGGRFYFAIDDVLGRVDWLVLLE